MAFSFRKLVLAMMHPEVLVKPDIDQSIVTAPAIGMNHRAGLHMAADNALQGGFRAVWHDLSVDLTRRFSSPNTMVLP